MYKFKCIYHDFSHTDLSVYIFQGLSFNRPKVPRQKAVCDQEAKRLYLEEARQFAASLAEGLEEQDGNCLIYLSLLSLLLRLQSLETLVKW